MTAVLLDFFGTLVGYEPSRVVQGYPATTALLHAAGLDLDEGAWLTRFDDAFERRDVQAVADHVEYTMHDVYAEFAEGVGLDHALADRFVATYLGEWTTAVHLLEGVTGLLATLSGRGHPLVLVTNTHHTAMVHDLLDRFGLDRFFAAVVASDALGVRKPHPRIYETALDAVGGSAEDAVFAGDSFEPDYAGPRRVGIRSFLVDPGARYVAIPAAHRLAHITELADRIG